MVYYSHKSLVKTVEEQDIPAIECPDAVFIMLFRREKLFTPQKLKILREINCPVFFIGSCSQDKAFFSSALLSENFHYLPIDDHPYSDFLSSFKTRKHLKTEKFCSTWDLDMKRNLAVITSQERGYKKILLLDDDIFGFDLNHLKEMTHISDTFHIVGSFPNEFPDDSVCGHICRLTGLPQDVFLSGSFLLINLTKFVPFFPGIYNEDWFALFPALKKKVCAGYKTVHQAKYDPFKTTSTAQNQEFGDLLVEGVFSTIHLDSYDKLSSTLYWENCISERRDLWENLLKNLKGNQISNPYYSPSNNKVEKIIKKAMETLAKIKTQDCITFLEDWDSDKIAWYKSTV